MFVSFSGAPGTPANRLNGLFGGAVADVDVALLAAEVDAAEAAEGAHLEDVDVRRLLRLVRGDGCVAGRRALHDVQRLPGDDHVAVAGAVGGRGGNASAVSG